MGESKELAWGLGITLRSPFFNSFGKYHKAKQEVNSEARTGETTDLVHWNIKIQVESGSGAAKAFID
jgi:hypothetical protein